MSAFSRLSYEEELALTAERDKLRAEVEIAYRSRNEAMAFANKLEFRDLPALRLDLENAKRKLTALVEACEGIVWHGRGEMRDWTDDEAKIAVFDKALADAQE